MRRLSLFSCITNVSTYCLTFMQPQNHTRLAHCCCWNDYFLLTNIHQWFRDSFHRKLLSLKPSWNMTKCFIFLLGMYVRISASWIRYWAKVVEWIGIEPMTLWLQTTRSTNCATTPLLHLVQRHFRFSQLCPIWRLQSFSLSLLSFFQATIVPICRCNTNGDICLPSAVADGFTHQFAFLCMQLLCFLSD